MSAAAAPPPPPPPPPGPSPSPPGPSPSPPGPSPPPSPPGPSSPPPPGPDFDDDGNKIVIGKVHCSLCMSIGRDALHATSWRCESIRYVKPASGVEGNRL